MWNCFRLLSEASVLPILHFLDRVLRFHKKFTKDTLTLKKGTDSPAGCASVGEPCPMHRFGFWSGHMAGLRD